MGRNKTVNCNKSFEENMKELELIVAKLEMGEESIDDSFKLFEDGIKIASLCYEKLNDTKQKVFEISDFKK